MKPVATEIAGKEHLNYKIDIYFSLLMISYIMKKCFPPKRAHSP